MVIIDDSPLIVDRLQKMLVMLEGVTISGIGTNIGSGFTLIQEVMPDVVILDIYLEDDAPAANGLSLLAVITEAFPKILVIMLTNLSGTQYKNKCLKMGAKYFLDKSNEFERIPEILTDIIYSTKTPVHEWPQKKDSEK